MTDNTPIYQQLDAVRDNAGRVLERIGRHEDRADETAKATRYSEGDVVEYDSDGKLGAVTAVMTEDFTIPVGDEDEEDVQASEDSPVYVVARETRGFDVFRGSELSAGEFPDHEGSPEDMTDADVENSYSALDSDTDPHSERAGAILRTLEKDGWLRYPPSWRDSPVPGRVILLDAWTSMGGSFTGCVRHMSGDIATPDDFCAATKDEVLGTTRWRNRGF